MTRARFLLVSLFAGIAACFGLSREALCRRWLKRNGFVIEEYERQILGSTDVFYTAVVSHTGIGISGGVIRRQLNTPIVNVASSYLDHLSRNNFTIIQRHLQFEFDPTCSVVGEWPEVKLKEVELAPPTIHRFERPWFV